MPTYRIKCKHRHASNRILGFWLKRLDMWDLLSWVQPLWTSTSTVQYGVATIKLEFVINGLQSLFSVFITTVAYPPAINNISALNNPTAKVSLSIQPIKKISIYNRDTVQ